MLPGDRLTFLLFLLSTTVTTMNCDNLLVKTDSGYVRGVVLRTLLKNTEYIAYRGIPYAKPPVGDLRFKPPVPISPWSGIFQAIDYGNSCLVLHQSQLFPLNSTQSEDCLYLNVFTTVTSDDQLCAKKAVMFFIHGGAFTEGDGTDGFYGPDFIVDNDVILVTFNYRLGPWGFANFDVKGYTGNMGFKDQQMALEWIHQNIRYFGGDPSKITVFGESAGGVATHLHLLSEKSRKFMKRAIAMSGSAFSMFAFCEPNDHVELFKDVFKLDAQATGQDVLEFMLNAPVDLILQNAPVMSLERGLIHLYFGVVIENETIAEDPFLIRRPLDIYETTKVDVESMFGATSLESLALLVAYPMYFWYEPLKDNYSNIGLPFRGLTLSPNSSVYQDAVRKIYAFYFGHEKLEDLQPNEENFINYFEMSSDMNFVHPVNKSFELHSKYARTSRYVINLNLKLNVVKLQANIEYLPGMSHAEDMLYLFLSKKYSDLYANVLANPTDPINKKTLRAFQFVPKMFTDYCKTGLPMPTVNCNAGIEITNDGLKPMDGSRDERIKFWDSIYDSVRPWL